MLKKETKALAFYVCFLNRQTLVSFSFISVFLQFSSETKKWAASRIRTQIIGVYDF